MIDAPPAIVAPAPIPFAPPPGRPIGYVMIDRQPAEAGDTVVTLEQTMRFDRTPTGFVATQTLVRATVAAPPRAKALIEALEAPFVGASLAVALAADGTPGVPIEAERRWAPVAASFAALERKGAAPGMIPPRAAAAVPRDARLRDSVALLLPPALPALRPGETRAFTTTIAAFGAPLPAGGTTALVAATPDRLSYRIEVAGDRAAAAAHAARMRARLVATTPAAERSRIEAMAAALESGTFGETIDVEIDPRTGLLRHLHSARSAVDPQGIARLIAERTIAQIR